jgi:4'-phosphopantetheinyl transferase
VKQPLITNVHIAFAREEDVLSAANQTAISRAFPGMRRPSAIARILLQELLAAGTGLAPGCWKIESEPSGRPMIAANGPSATLPISLSHSRGWVACAASQQGQIGVDIESARAGRDWRCIAASAFGPKEHQRVNADGECAFYRIWTLREAIAKACGMGLGMAADGTDRVHEGPAQGSWTVNADGRSWLLHHARPKPNLFLSLAFSTPPNARSDQVDPLPVNPHTFFYSGKPQRLNV